MTSNTAYAGRQRPKHYNPSDLEYEIYGRQSLALFTRHPWRAS
ncbi:hypothetical protein HMPREF1705_04672 [Acetomicrobium hydrogeniformans ATCC BAA-1850]|uniref:Uncharacterized protein n=1 Tax=Acetomicrobium hydrogeniformans ATCC BAA-1850 TaxID=592015 RepID=A0A0T5XB69_9BACT|nr:hypothetical protein HMPREF1705_04672 [Acetomicrobium hydrogeniformans ATCC BAA-1850]